MSNEAKCSEVCRNDLSLGCVLPSGHKGDHLDGIEGTQWGGDTEPAEPVIEAAPRAEIDAAFAGMATDEAYQKEALELAAEATQVADPNELGDQLRPRTPIQVASRDLDTPPPTSLIELAKDIVAFADAAGMADDCWRWRLGGLRRAMAAQEQKFYSPEELDAHRALEDKQGAPAPVQMRCPRHAVYFYYQCEYCLMDKTVNAKAPAAPPSDMGAEPVLPNDELAASRKYASECFGHEWSLLGAIQQAVVCNIVLYKMWADKARERAEARTKSQEDELRAAYARIAVLEDATVAQYQAGRASVEGELETATRAVRDTKGFLNETIARIAVLEMLLREETSLSAALAGPCQKSQMSRCLCDACRKGRVRAALADAPHDGGQTNA